MPQISALLTETMADVTAVEIEAAVKRVRARCCRSV
jgi:hypothetical protein